MAPDIRLSISFLAERTLSPQPSEAVSEWKGSSLQVVLVSEG